MSSNKIYRIIDGKIHRFAGRFTTKPAAEEAAKEWLEYYSVYVLPYWVNLKKHWEVWIRHKIKGVYVEPQDILKVGVEKEGWQ